eukprot:228433-Hanusia_phi.AAC.1
MYLEEPASVIQIGTSVKQTGKLGQNLGESAPAGRQLRLGRTGSACAGAPGLDLKLQFDSMISSSHLV